MKNLIILPSLIVISFALGLYAGGQIKQNEFEKRALDLPDDEDLTNADIEHILFGEPQL